VDGERRGMRKRTPNAAKADPLIGVPLTIAEASESTQVLTAEATLSRFEPYVVRASGRLVVAVLGLIFATVRIDDPRKRDLVWRPVR
jgi:hypothetical protein